MTTRLALFDLIARNDMNAQQASALWRLAGFDDTPPRALTRIRRGLAIGGAACVGLGLIFAVAANWALLSRTGQFMLLQALVLAPCAGVAAWARGRAALGLLALVATGGLFAYFGQTYQTGANTWQLFAVWAALALPIACCARSDTVWAAWAVVALTGIVLHERTYAGDLNDFGSDGASVVLAATGAAVALTTALRTVARRWLGAGAWTFGMALVVTAFWVTISAVTALDAYRTDHACYWLSLVLAMAVAALLLCVEPFDVFAASVVALGLNVLLVAGLATVLFTGSSSEWIGFMLLLGLFAAGLLAGSVKVIVARAGVARTKRVTP